MAKATKRMAKSAKSAKAATAAKRTGSRMAGAGPRPVLRDDRPAEPQHVLRIAQPKCGETRSVEAAGPALFLGAQVLMSNAPAGISQIGLEIDGRLVIFTRADQLALRQLAMPNATGAFATHASYGNLWTVVLGWPYPLEVREQVRLSVLIGEDMAELELGLLVGR